jgi:pimeloyl-ACP methyl ester carboxylesterase
MLSLVPHEESDMQRRHFLTAMASMAGTGLVAATSTPTPPDAPPRPSARARRAPRIEARDGTRLYYKDWGMPRERVVVFVSSWTLGADMWQYQMLPFVARGLRCVAYDRRGHGRSDQPSDGYDFDTLADDLATLLETLDLHRVTLVGHSMGAGEIARLLSRHGSARVERVALLSPTTPFLLQTADNPEAVPQPMFEAVRAAWLRDFPKWLDDNARPFVVPETSDAMIAWVKGLMLQCSLRAAVQCHVALTSTDFRADLREIRLPTLVVHGDKDVSAPFPLTGQRTAALIPHATLKLYEGGPHGLFITHMDRLNADLLAFING